MSIVERSINHYCNFFKFLVAFTIISILIMAIVLGSYEYKIMTFILPLFTFWMIIPIVWNYKNWKYFEKNKKELESATATLDVDSNKKMILSMKSIFTPN